MSWLPKRLQQIIMLRIFEIYHNIKSKTKSWINYNSVDPKVIIGILGRYLPYDDIYFFYKGFLWIDIL